MGFRAVALILAKGASMLDLHWLRLFRLGPLGQMACIAPGAVVNLANQLAASGADFIATCGTDRHRIARILQHFAKRADRGIAGTGELRAIEWIERDQVDLAGQAA